MFGDDEDVEKRGQEGDEGRRNKGKKEGRKEGSTRGKPRERNGQERRPFFCAEDRR